MVQLGQVQVDDFIACCIRTAVQQIGGFEWVTMAIVDAESGFDPNAVGDAGCSIGLLQLNTCGGQGSDYANNRDALKDPKLNLQIGQPFIARATLVATQEGLTGDDFMREVCRLSGHPGGIPRNDPRLDPYVVAMHRVITNAAGQLVAWPPNNPALCAGGVAAPPPLGSWAEPLNPQNKDQAQQVIEAHLARVDQLFMQF